LTDSRISSAVFVQLKGARDLLWAELLRVIAILNVPAKKGSMLSSRFRIHADKHTASYADGGSRTRVVKLAELA
jgi:hypothetical protein